MGITRDIGKRAYGLKTLKSQTADAPRAALYVDGFNLYHPIQQMGENHLKWACLWKMGEIICEKGGQQLVKVVFCTAVPKVEHNAVQHERHVRFNSALKARGVEVLNGHHVPEDVIHNGAPTGEKKWTEKQSDINVALSVIVDGIDDQYDVAFVLSADTDQVATARMFSQRVAPLGKTMIGVAPPGRRCPPGYGQYGITGISLTKYQIEQCVMPAVIQGKEKQIHRPTPYDPPDEWVHPDDRPKGKPPKAPSKSAWSKGTKA